MEPADILAEAYNAVKKAKIPKELEEAAFVRAIDLLTGGPVESKPQKPDAISSEPPDDFVDPDDNISSIAQRLGVERESAERIFHVDNGELKLVLNSNKLSNPKKSATQEIALLVVAGRQAGGLDEETTDADEIRKVAEHYRKYDRPNFSRAIKDLDEVFIIRENGRTKMLKMTQPGWEKTRTLVERIIGGE